MIVTWMLYCSLCALGLTLAATLAERLLLAGRAPVRIVWIGAVLLSLAIPLAGFRPFSAARSPEGVLAPQPIVVPAAMLLRANVDVPVIRRTADGAPEARAWSARITGWLRELDSSLVIVWAVLSATLAVSFISGVACLAWMRRRWDTRVVQGETVYVSRRTGPAIVGVLSPAIVIPDWALSLPASQLSLMLRHEREHLGARDGQLLIAAQIALIANVLFTMKCTSLGVISGHVAVPACAVLWQLLTAMSCVAFR